MHLELPTERLILKILDDSYADKANDYFLRNREYLCEFNPLDDDKFYDKSIRKRILYQEFIEFTNLRFLRFWIFKKSDSHLKKIIGTVSFANIIPMFTSSCTLGYSIDKNERNKGYTTEAINCAVNYIFTVYKLHRVEASVMESNKASVRVLEKCGFTREGPLIKYIKINGKWEDHIRMTLLNPKVE